jgi:hypothetical protein
MDLTPIDQKAKSFATEYAALTDTVLELNRRVQDLQNSFLRQIRTGVKRVADKRSELKAAIEANPHLFEKPRTVTVHGVKIGFTKQKGRIDIPDAENTVALIEKHFPMQADVLIKTEKTPVKKALANMTAVELKKLGVTVTADTDAVVINPVDSEVEKTVSALLKSLVNDNEPEAA